MITSFNQYVAGVLESESADQRGWREDIPPKLYRVNHALTGLVTEIGELFEVMHEERIDWVHVKEELGDLWWYTGLLVAASDVDAKVYARANTFDRSGSALQRAGEKGLIHLTKLVGESFDVVKRRIYYFAEELDDDDEKKAKALWSKMHVQEICLTLFDLTRDLGFSVEDVWTTNLLKLIGPNGRYAGVFDANKALHRDLVAEREVLEGETDD